MSRSNSLYKETYNLGLDLIGSLVPGTNLPAETELARLWRTSRTTVRAVLSQFDQAGLIRWDGRRKAVLRKPNSTEYYREEETQSASKRVEAAFMEYFLSGDLAPGTILRESELVREFGVSTSVVREHLIRFSRFGLIRKEPNRHWILGGFTRKFAVDLFDVREMFEMRGFRALLADHSMATDVESHRALEADHLKLIEDIDQEFPNFPQLDGRFHRLFLSRLDNRFVDSFYELVSLISHSQYRWNKRDQRDRHLVAAREHMAVLRALGENRITDAETAFVRHLQSARRTLLDSIDKD